MGEDISEPPTPVSNPIIRFNKPKQKSEDSKFNIDRCRNLSLPYYFNLEPSKSHKKTNSIHIRTESLSQDVPETTTPASAPETVSSPVAIDSNEHMDIEHVEPIVDVPFEPIERSPSPPPPPPPKPKHKKVDSATAEELKKCRRVINKLNKSRAALPFTEPVDEVLDGAPGYYKMITYISI